MCSPILGSTHVEAAGNQAAGVPLDVVVTNAAISACAKGGEWETALALLENMKRSGVSPDIISYNAVRACEECMRVHSAEVGRCTKITSRYSRVCLLGVGCVSPGGSVGKGCRPVGRGKTQGA